MDMIRCKFINFLFAVFPVKAFQGFLIKNHFEKCPRCLESQLLVDEAKALFLSEEEAMDLINVWPGIVPKLCEESAEKVRPSFWLRWRWAMGVAGLALFILVGFWFMQTPDSVELALQAPAEEQLQINYIKVEEKPAGAIVYEPQDSEMIIVWAERTP